MWHETMWNIFHFSIAATAVRLKDKSIKFLNCFSLSLWCIKKRNFLINNFFFISRSPAGLQFFKLTRSRENKITQNFKRQANMLEIWDFQDVFIFKKNIYYSSSSVEGLKKFSSLTFLFSRADMKLKEEHLKFVEP